MQHFSHLEVEISLLSDAHAHAWLSKNIWATQRGESAGEREREGSSPRTEEEAGGLKRRDRQGLRGWVWKGGKGERDGEKLASCERLQSFLTRSSIPADSMSHPTLQQGQSRVIPQAYSALLRPCSSSIQGLVVPGLHKVYFHCHASRKEGLDDDAVTVTMSEEVCLRQRGQESRRWRTQQKRAKFL